MKKFLSRLYAFFAVFLSYNPIQKPQWEHFDFVSPKGKLQKRVVVGEKVVSSLDRATRRAFNMENFENFEDFDDLEDYEDYEELEKTEGTLTHYERENYEREFLEEFENLRGNPKAQKMAYRKVGKKYGKRGKAWAYMANKKSTTSLTGGQQGGEVATVSINVTRLTNNIQQDLPVQLFNVIDNYADSRTLKRYLPAGVTLASSNSDATRTNWVFIFQQGALVDTVVLSCTEVSYNMLQLATQNDLFRIGRTLFKISDKAQQQAFNQRFTIVTQTLFGFGKENPLTLTNYIDPKNFREDSVVISTAYDIDKQSGIIMGVPYVAGGTNFRITLGISVSRFDQWNRTRMR